MHQLSYLSYNIVMSKLDDQQISNNDTFCILPWIHLEIRENGNIYPCSRSLSAYPLGDFKKLSYSKIWNSEEFKKLRLNMLNNVKSKHCIDCYRIEKYNGTSLRKKFNFTNKDKIPLIHQTKTDGSLEKFDLNFVSIRLSNLCNLKCQYCDHNSSTAWITDQRKLGYQGEDLLRTDSFSSKEECLDFFSNHIDTLKAIYLIGGEPLIDPYHNIILDYFIEQGRSDIAITYNSNLTELSVKGTDLVEKWKFFDKVILDASIDSHQERNDYIRYGSSWDKLERNIVRLKDHSNVKLRFYPTISIFNVFTLIESIKYWLDKEYIQGHEIIFNILEGPEYFNIQTLPNESKREIRENIIQFTKELFQNYDMASAIQLSKQFKELLQFLETSHEGQDNLRAFREHCDKIDQLRGSNWREVFPELIF
ncbi:putative Radical SAM domain protein [Halobacteriovorax marinus SJ]|uniref:Radical SAM domain protein n=2 Tax=Halobacteriovorax marinus TaxID=97084 RepID=E1X1N4_HALMS|nr:putative Radical SAM domain protein [Halobacteriovorax marinus SJ]